MVPFAITQRVAHERLRAHLADAIWAPEAVRRLARSGQLRPEELRGMLVPYIIYAASSTARWRARIGVDWWRSETTEDRHGKAVTTRVRNTEWFDAQGTAVGSFDEHHECASSILTAAEAEQLGPFDLGVAVRFDPRLLAGFGAELPSRSRAEVDGDARESLRRRALRYLATQVLPGEHHDVVGFDCEVTLHALDVVLMPVWVASFRYEGQLRRILVHGRHGACVGRPPVSGTKVSLAAAALAALVVLILWLAGVWS